MSRHASALAALQAAGVKSKLDPESEMELLVKRQVQALEVIALVVSEAMDFLEVLALSMDWGISKGDDLEKLQLTVGRLQTSQLGTHGVSP